MPRTTDPPSRPSPGKLPDPFIKPEAIKPTIMALISGPPKVGKTYLALQGAPRPMAVIDSEGSAQWYVGRKGFEPFALLHTKSYRELMAALDYIEANPGAYETLVIDSMSVFYSVLQDAAVASRTARVVAAGGDPADVDIEMKDWGRIKRLNKALMSRLMNLPLNVLVTVREKDAVEKRGGEFVKVGVKPDADKGIEYDAALLIRLDGPPHRKDGNRVALSLGGWTEGLPPGTEVANPTWSNLFAPLLARGGNAKATRAVQSDEAAAHEDATSMGTRLATPLEAQALAEAMTAAGYDPEEVRERKGWPPFGEMGAVKTAELIAFFEKKVAKPEPAPEVAA